MSWNCNPYYKPEHFGLEIVASIDVYEPNYDFDIRVVWFHSETGVFYTARDAGCSCPSPFEDYHGLEQLDVLDEGMLEAIRSELEAANTAGRSEFMQRVERAVFRADRLDENE